MIYHHLLRFIALDGRFTILWPMVSDFTKTAEVCRVIA